MQHFTRWLNIMHIVKYHAQNKYIVRIRVTPDKLLGSHLNELNIMNKYSIHKTIMVITVRAHCYPLDISPTAQAVWALSWIGWGAPFVGRSLFALCIAHCSQFEHSGDFTMQSKQCVKTYFLCPKCRSLHKTIMVITVRAHCYPLAVY